MQKETAPVENVTIFYLSRISTHEIKTTSRTNGLDFVCLVSTYSINVLPFLQKYELLHSDYEQKFIKQNLISLFTSAMSNANIVILLS